MSLLQLGRPWDTIQLLLEALPSLDSAKVGEVYSDNLRASYNFLSEPLTKQGALSMLEQTFQKVVSLAFSSIEATETSDGFALEFTLNVSSKNGREIRSRNCIVASVDRDGKIDRLREYLDPAAFAALDEPCSHLPAL